MPIIKKIINIGKTSQGIILPKGWLNFQEQENNSKITEVSMDVNGAITIRPRPPKKET
jgi:hypothetical protein